MMNILRNFLYSRGVSYPILLASTLEFSRIWFYQRWWLNLRRNWVIAPESEWAPLYMSPVNRAGSVSEVSSRHSFLRKISMCLYEKAGWGPFLESPENFSGPKSHS